jgi:hypothetical protein
MVADEITYFREVQSFRQWWIQLLVLPMAGYMWYSAYSQFILGKSIGNNPASDTSMLIMWLIFGIIFPIFMYSLRLTVEVRNSGLYFQFYPFHLSLKRIPFQDLKSYEARDYRPLRDYGGWGLRYGLGGKAYTTHGTRGLILEFSNGKRLMLGSQKADEFEAALRLAIGTVN